MRHYRSHPFITSGLIKFIAPRSIRQQSGGVLDKWQMQIFKRYNRAESRYGSIIYEESL